MDKRSTMAKDESSLVSNRAVQINKRLAKGKHAQVCKLSPSPQSRQPILLSLFFLALMERGAEQLTYLSPHTNLQNSLLSV